MRVPFKFEDVYEITEVSFMRVPFVNWNSQKLIVNLLLHSGNKKIKDQKVKKLFHSIKQKKSRQKRDKYKL